MPCITTAIDPRDGATTDHWRIRLATIFSSLLAARPNYTQIRYIGLTNNGQELVRVNKRKNGALEVTPVAKLQEKSAEPYFQDAVKLQQDDVYYSSITYDPESKGQSTNAPIIRIVLPVFDDQGNRFGLVSINADYEVLLTDALNEMDLHEEVYISDSFGTYISRDQQGNVSPLHVAGADAAPSLTSYKSF